ncbi:MAG: A/G-specific adenine glycosylase [Acidobacteriota bacterium]|nr:A/G-specific adenine glycosylase [Acidobacteriota bacterium]
MPIPAHITRKSEKWFRTHQRELPWRANYDPYHVWLSEVMLQQTQMPVVLRYYKNFLERFPTISALAAASTDDVAAAWSGLGYYRRARMLREGAIEVRDRFSGALPDDVASLMSLPGIGRYTAGAIASIAYDRVAPIVDGNITRIVARLYGNDRDPWQRAETLVKTARSPRMFNQALMEIGALICRPKNPQCNRCPLRTECRAFARGRTALAPRKRAATRNLRIALYIVTDRRGRILMRRESGTLFDGMWVLPVCRWPSAVRRGSFRHTITNRRITFEVFTANGKRPTAHEWIAPTSLANIPHPSYVRKALEIAGLC